MATSELENAAVNETMKGTPFYRFFIFGLKELLGVEKNIVEALPDMIEAATSESLKSALGSHLQETKEHVHRLQNALEILHEKPKDSRGKAMASILNEGQVFISETKENTAVRDAAIIMAAKKVEHYEITSYGSLITFSKLMLHNSVTRLLEATLREEERADTDLTELGEEHINGAALREP